MAYDLLISGAGMVGSALALGLTQQGFRVAVAERRSAEQCAAVDPYARASLINAGATRLLTAMGIPVAELGSPVERLRVWDAEHPGGIQLDAADAGATVLGYIVENRRLEQTLHQALAAAGVAMHYATLWQRPWQEEQGIQVQDQNGQTYSGTLLAIAEGRQSELRKTLLRGSLLREDYGQEAITATVTCERSHLNTGWQRFLPTGPIALLPFAPGTDGQHRVSLVWSARRVLARRLLSMNDAQFLQALETQFGPQLGRLLAIGPRSSHPLSALHLNDYIAPRAVALGDSAHGVHPLAGLGVNLGFRDVAALLDVITDAQGRREDWGQVAVLRRYQRQRRPDNLATVLVCSGLHHLFTQRSRSLAGLRDIGLWAATVTPGARAFFVRQAMSL